MPDNRPFVSWEQAAPCGQDLDLVDAAFDRPGGPAAKELEERFCRRCPVLKDCLLLGMQGRPGAWGGTSQNWRTAHGGKPVRIRTKTAL